jgi:hypothetical protein
MKEYSKVIDLKMSFTTQLLKGCVMSDIVKVINRYLRPNPECYGQVSDNGVDEIPESALIPKYIAINNICKFGLFEQLLEYDQNNFINYNTELATACKYGYLEIVKWLSDSTEVKVPLWKRIFQLTGLKRFNIIKKRANDWNMGLYGACRGGHMEIVNLMIKKGANKWNWGFRWACQCGHLEIVKLLIDKGADEWNEGLRWACEGSRHFDFENSGCSANTRLEIINLMIEKGADYWNGGLESACYGGNLEIVKLMIEKGANSWNSGLYSACYGGNLAYNNSFYVKNTKKALPETNVRSTRFAYDNPFCAKGTERALLEANACSTHLEIVKLMIEKGATHCGNCTNHVIN